MSTYTAQILVGSPHPNHDGLEPTHSLYLSENSRPAWILVKGNLWADELYNNERIVWIPTIENMIDDALLMIGLYIVQDKELQAKISKYLNRQQDIVEIHRDIKKNELKKLYEMNKRALGQRKGFKIIATVFRDSTAHKLLDSFLAYSIDMEICAPIYSRLSSPWLAEVRIEGALPPSSVKITKYPSKS
jgi:hypothetical protein